jgi:adenylate cyclase
LVVQLKALWKRFFSSLNLIIRVTLSLAIVIFFILCETEHIQVQFFKQLELLAYDMRLKLTLPNTIDPRIVIVDIDEKSLVAEGRWPWNRDKMALLTRQLFDRYKVKVLGFDVLFSEPDETSGLANLEQLGKNELKADNEFQAILPRLRKDLDYDGKFADVIKNYPVVLSFAGSSNLEASKLIKIGQLPPPTFTTNSFGKRQIVTTTLAGYSANLKVLQENSASTGHMLPDLDVDGILRRVPMLVKHEDGFYESISLAIYRTYRDNAPIKAVFPGAAQDPGGELGLSRIEVGETRIPLDDSTTALVPYRGQYPKFRYISATDILRGTLPEGELSGKIALVGTSVQGLLDLRSTPVGTAYPGVEVHANLLSGFLDNRIKEKSEYDSQVGTALMLLFGVLISFLLPRLSPVLATLLILVVLSVTFGLNMYQWQYNNTVYSIALFLLMIIVLYMYNMAFGFFVEARSKRAIVSRFGEYVPKELVSEMAKNPEDYSMKGESREMTVLFSDIRNFTSISEGLAPDQLSLLMNSYLTPMTEVIQKHRGTIDKYIGDAIMAFWGAPVPDPDHVTHALATALDMQKVLTTMGPDFRKRGWPVLHIGVGVNCGKMSVGNMGSQFRRAYTVMGDAVNLASRLEGLTKEYGVGILVSENIVESAPIAIYRELDRVRVKGKLEPISIYEPMGMVGEVGDQVIDETDRFHKVLKRFRSQEWDEAERLLKTLLYSAPETKLYKLYLDRINIYRADPPGPNWDGVFVFTTK